MDAGQSTLSLDRSQRERGTLTSVDLPAGPGSGGLLLDDSGAQLLLLFGEESVEAGDEVELPPRRTFTVTSVRHGRMNGQPVTVLRVRAAGVAGGS